MDVVDTIGQTGVDENQKPTEDITINSVSIETVYSEQKGTCHMAGALCAAPLFVKTFFLHQISPGCSLRQAR